MSESVNRGVQTTQWPKDTKGVISESVNRGVQTTQWPKDKGQKVQTTIYKTYM